MNNEVADIFNNDYKNKLLLANTLKSFQESST